MTDLLVIAEAQIAEKQVKEIENIKKRLDSDKETIKKAIELVNTHTLYKKVETGRYNYKYVLATEEMLKEDYIGEPKNSYCFKGIRFLHADTSRAYNTGVLEVNGEKYYDIHFALEQYEKRITEKAGEISRLTDKILDLKKDIELMEENFPTLKQALVEWQEYQKKMESEAEWQN